MEENRQNEDSPAPDTRRRICVVSETYYPQVNGVALTLSHLVKGLQELGHRVSIVRPQQQRSDSRGLDPSVTVVAGTPPKETDGTPAKAVPLMVTVVPPASGPAAGDTAVTVGTAM